MKRIRIGPWELRLARGDWWDQEVDMEIDFAAYLKRHVEEILKLHGCSHGHDDVESTAPMFYPELICCALHHQREQGRALGRAEALTAEKPKENA